MTLTSPQHLPPGSTVDLSAVDPAGTPHAPGDKQATREASAGLADRLAELQEQMHAGRAHRLLLVLQGIDTAGKGGTIKHVLGAVHPVGLRVTSFKAPTAAELSHDFLWRIHAAVPAAGELGVFDRSHYEDVLVARVEGLVPEQQWQRRYDHINAFERLLVDEGTTIVKVLLHISRDEQRKRLQSRIDRPDKRWKFAAEDLRTRRRWDDYQTAFEEALTRTGTDHAPWYVVPADHKWYRDWVVATILVDTLESLDLRWPDPDGLDGLVVD